MKLRTTTPRLLTTLAAAGTITLAGCTGGDDGAVAPETVTATETAATNGDPAAPAAEATVTEDASAAPTDDVPADDLPYGPVGSEVTIAGESATVCIHGDGWGTNIWAGNANTSCEFVSEAHQALVEGLNATEDNIRNHLREQVTVNSPVTGQDYVLTCVPRGERLVTCSGGEGAAVHFY